MKKIVVLTCVVPFFMACSSTTKLVKPDVSEEIPIAQLSEKDIAAINPEYKKSYFRVMPYLFFNKNGTFNEIQGDFYNVKFNTSSDINIMPGYWREYGPYQNSLIVLIAMTPTSSLPLKNIPINVESSKNGIFEKVEPIGNSTINQNQQRVLFVKKLHLENRYDVLNKLNDDVITVRIGAQIYNFLTPELTID